MQPSLALMRAGKRGDGRHAALRLAVVLAAIAALLWQSFVVQTHIHYSASPVHTASGISQAGHPGESPADCPICREMAQAAAYLTPTLPLFSALVLAHVLLVEQPIAASVFVAFAPPWRSRAPPLPLRA